MSHTQTNPNSLKNLTYNHVPLNEEKVRAEFEKRGYQIIDYTYKNNMTRMNCYDSEGYIVKVSYESFSHNTKQYVRFSTKCNEENFLYNTNLYAQKHNMKCIVLDWRKSQMKAKKNNHIDVLCQCECGELYWYNFNQWKRELKDRCQKCSHKLSYIAKRTQDWLKDNNIEYIPEYRFEDCRNQKPLPFDYYLPKYNICIEVDGEQHFYSYAFGYKKKKYQNCIREEMISNEFNIRKHNDDIKTQYCKEHNIKLIRLKYTLFRSNNQISDKYKEVLQKEIYNS